MPVDVRLFSKETTWKISMATPTNRKGHDVTKRWRMQRCAVGGKGGLGDFYIDIFGF